MDFGFSLPFPDCQPDSAIEVRSRTLRISDLEDWMDEKYLLGCFYRTRLTTFIEVVHNKQSGQSKGYGLIECLSRAAAGRIMKTYNGTPMPRSDHSFKLSWATFDGEPETERHHDAPNQYSEGKIEFSGFSETSGTSESKAEEINNQCGDEKPKPHPKEVFEDTHLTSYKRMPIQRPFLTSYKRMRIGGARLTSYRRRLIEDELLDEEKQSSVYIVMLADGWHKGLQGADINDESKYEEIKPFVEHFVQKILEDGSHHICSWNYRYFSLRLNPYQAKKLESAPEVISVVRDYGIEFV